MIESAYLIGFFLSLGLFLFSDPKVGTRTAAVMLSIIWPASWLVIIGAVIGRAVIDRAKQ